MAKLSKLHSVAVGLSVVTLPVLLYLLLKSERRSMFIIIVINPLHQHDLFQAQLTNNKLVQN